MPNLSIHRVIAGLFLCVPLMAYAIDETDVSDFSLEELLQVKIVGASKYEQKANDVAASVKVITRDEIRTYGWRTLGEALNSLPGMYSTYDHQYSQMGMRGFSLPGDYNTRILFTINGNRVNDAVYDEGRSGRDFPLEMDLIDHIEFIPGPGGAIYGQNAMLGVINVITRKGSEVNGTELSASFHEPQSARKGQITWGKKLDNGLDALVSAAGFHSKGEDLFVTFPGADINGWPTSGIARGMDGERNNTLFTSLARGPWSFDFNYGDRRKYDPLASYFGDPLTPGQYQQDRHRLTQLQYQDSLTGTLQLTGRLFLGQERYLGAFINSGVTSLSTASSDWWGGELRLLSTRWDHHKILLGLEYQENKRQDQALLYPANPASNIVIPDSGWRQGVYIQDEWALSSALSSTLGIRFDDNNITGGTLSPRAGLIWQATPSTTIQALYGQAHRAPNAYERNYSDGLTNIGNASLNSETIKTLELAMDQRIGKSLQLHGSIYRWEMQGLIHSAIDPVSGLIQYNNGQNVNSQGIELSANKSWNNDAKLQGNVNYVNAEYANGIKLANSPRLMGKLNFSTPLRLAGLRIGYELQYYGPRETLISGISTGGYTISNLNLIADKWAKGLKLSLGFYNLFDKSYSLPASNYNWQDTLQQDGRQIRLKAIYAF